MKTAAARRQERIKSFAEKFEIIDYGTTTVWA